MNTSNWICSWWSSWCLTFSSWSQYTDGFPKNIRLKVEKKIQKMHQTIVLEKITKNLYMYVQSNKNACVSSAKRIIETISSHIFTVVMEKLQQILVFHLHDRIQIMELSILLQPSVFYLMVVELAIELLRIQLPITKEPKENVISNCSIFICRRR